MDTTQAERESNVIDLNERRILKVEQDDISIMFPASKNFEIEDDPLADLLAEAMISDGEFEDILGEEVTHMSSLKFEDSSSLMYAQSILDDLKSLDTKVKKMKYYLDELD